MKNVPIAGLVAIIFGILVLLFPHITYILVGLYLLVTGGLMIAKR